MLYLIFNPIGPWYHVIILMYQKKYKFWTTLCLETQACLPSSGFIYSLIHKYKALRISQFSSVAQLTPTLWDPMDCSMPSLPVHHQLPEVLKVMPIQSVMPSNHLILCHSPFPPAFNLSQNKGLFKWVSSLHQVAKVLEFQLQHQSFQWIFRTDFL